MRHRAFDAEYHKPPQTSRSQQQRSAMRPARRLHAERPSSLRLQPLPSPPKSQLSPRRMNRSETQAPDQKRQDEPSEISPWRVPTPTEEDNLVFKTAETENAHESERTPITKSHNHRGHHRLRRAQPDPDLRGSPPTHHPPSPPRHARVASKQVLRARLERKFQKQIENRRPTNACVVPMIEVAGECKETLSELAPIPPASPQKEELYNWIAEAPVIDMEPNPPPPNPPSPTENLSLLNNKSKHKRSKGMMYQASDGLECDSLVYGLTPPEVMGLSIGAVRALASKEVEPLSRWLNSEVNPD